MCDYFLIRVSGTLRSPPAFQRCTANKNYFASLTEAATRAILEICSQEFKKICYWFLFTCVSSVNSICYGVCVAAGAMTATEGGILARRSGGTSTTGTLTGLADGRKHERQTSAPQYFQVAELERLSRMTFVWGLGALGPVLHGL